jgi:hypothetical protein
MQHGFFRVFFGDPWDKPMGGGGDVIFDILHLKTNKIEEDNKTLMMVFGKENLSRLVDLGFSCLLLDKNNLVLQKGVELPHKFLAYEVATSIFDEAIFMDIDCQQMIPLPDNFWQIYSSKAKLQASLLGYHRRMNMPWRTQDFRTVPCGCFVYMRGKEISKLMIDKMNYLAKNDIAIGNEEVVLAAVADEMDGGWKGAEEYAKKHEPTFFHTGCCYAPPADEPKVFDHFLRQGRVIRGLQRAGIFHHGMTTKEALDAAMKIRLDHIQD